ncbi:MAG: UDP-N-acetylmuramoyl-L-alanyl-D-glutamate--2,6-diaminopimelate ligase [Actinomycetia bacterium]|nr:UDP-N-acetylmuramoyl-L-alanyl-D-glutamate--2,6-diaminopimelate ligase [Actinomycetes bacterium]
MSTPLGPRSAAISLATIADVASGDLVGSAEVAIHGVTLDSRAVRPGDLYAALPGSNHHGGSFVGGAVDAGAQAVLTDPAGAELIAAAGISIPQVLVADPRAVLGAVAARVYGTHDPGLRLIGITGTNGKTTIAYLLAAALEALGDTVGLIGTVETRIGSERVRSVRTTPESPEVHRLLALMGERSVDDCVMEVSSHALALHRVDGICFDLALFTNLSQDHLDFHPDMADYFAAKASLFTPTRARRGLICIDGEWGQHLAARASIPVVTLGSSSSADYQVLSATSAEGSEHPTETAEFVLLTPRGSRLSLRSALPGVFNVTNTAMATAALIEGGIAEEDVVRAVLSDPHVPGRMERVSAPADAGRGTDPEQDPLAIVDYAHTPDAVAAAITALQHATTGPLIVVLGAGGGRDVGKREPMGRAAAQADIVIVTDDNPRSEHPAEIRAAVLRGAHAAGTDAVIEEVAGRRDAIVRAVELARQAPRRATIALVGKGHESGQEIDGVVHPFDDRVELQHALSATPGEDR